MVTMPGCNEPLNEFPFTEQFDARITGDPFDEITRHCLSQVR
jgi:hypothetical protein